MMEPSQLFGEAFACAGIEKLPVTATAVTDSEIYSAGLPPCHHHLRQFLADS